MAQLPVPSLGQTLELALVTLGEVKDVPAGIDGGSAASNKKELRKVISNSLPGKPDLVSNSESQVFPFPGLSTTVSLLITIYIGSTQNNVPLHVLNNIRIDLHKHNIANIPTESNFSEPICNCLFVNASGVTTHQQV